MSSDSGEGILRANREASSADGGIQRADIGERDVARLLTGVDRGYGSPLVIGQKPLLMKTDDPLAWALDSLPEQDPKVLVLCVPQAQVAGVTVVTLETRGPQEALKETWGMQAVT